MCGFGQVPNLPYGHERLLLREFWIGLIRMPLHYQIFIALIAGTVVGLFVNPGDVPLDDTQVEVTLAIEPASRGETIAVAVEDPQNRESFRKTFPNLAAVEAAYPQLAELYREDQQRHEFDATIRVTDRRVHFAEDRDSITINYTRRHDGRAVVTRHSVSSVEEMRSRFPQFAELYSVHGGGVRADIAVAAKYVGDLFLRLLKMVTIPLIVTSLVSGVAGLGSTSRLGSMFGKTLLYYVTTSMLAITTGIFMVNLVRPGIGADLPGGGEAQVAEGEQSLASIFTGLLDSMIPPNPIQALAEAEFLSIITFSILIGIFIIRVGGESGATLQRFFNAGFDVTMGITMFIIHLAPVGVFAFMLYATATQGVDIFKTLAWYMLTVFLGLVFHAAIILPLIVRVIGNRAPWQYAQAVSPALMTAFSTASSNGTLPLTINCVETRAGISNRISSFVLPLGATVNMDGTALYEAVAVLFIAQATPGFAMTLEAQIVVAITALLASVGAAGIPHAGLVMMAIVLQAVGLPLEAQGVIIAVDRILDMCRTSVNVWSDACGCAVVARFEGNAGPEGTSET